MNLSRIFFDGGVDKKYKDKNRLKTLSVKRKETFKNVKRERQ
jgi:hypothetical protein